MTDNPHGEDGSRRCNDILCGWCHPAPPTGDGPPDDPMFSRTDDTTND